jgi:short-subunit dehydrogenase
MRKNTLITGASSGLGAGMARHLAATGHNLVLTARRVDRLEELRDELLALNSEIVVVVEQLDVDEADQVFSVFERAAEEVGGLDRVIVNAGIGRGARIGAGRWQENRATATTNFLAALVQCEAAMQHFYDRGEGHLVVISSVTADRGMSGAVNTYAATKAAMGHIAEGIRLDLARRQGHDIAVTTLFPGYIESDMTESVPGKKPFMVSVQRGTAEMVDLIEREVSSVHVPRWPWEPIGMALRNLPIPISRHLL